MSTELPKTYDPAAVEATAYKTWLDEGCFHADPAAGGEGYTIVIPPPNVTGALHLGHAMDNTLQDILIRRHRMAGFNALWIPGIDHAGIATQAVVEKQLKEKENKTRHDIGRAGLIERIWAWKQQYGDRILSQLQRLGCSCDWDRTRFTLDEMCARAVRQTFFRLFKDGLIYRGKRLVNWDVFLQTSVSDDEIYHETVKTSLWHIRYEIEDAAPAGSQPSASPLAGGAAPSHMIVATTRPETLLGDTAVAVHSQDPRWNWAIGKRVRLPLSGRLIPIIADDILVDPKFGTGVVKVTPAHDPNDYAVWQRHQGRADQIDLINILTPEGRINDNGGAYAGLPRDKARKLIVEHLTQQGLLEKEEPHEAQVGHSDRSKTPIEPYLSDQWFVKMAPLAEPALEVVRDGTIKFYPERHAQQYLAWLGEKRDWPISRQLWWGHRLPVFAIEYSGLSAVEMVQKLKSMAKAAGLEGELEIAVSEGRLYACSVNDAGDGFLQYLATFASESDENGRKDASQKAHARKELIARLPSLGSMEAEFQNMEQWVQKCAQDPDVLDTWFSSALWPHSTLGWPEKTPELAKYYPTSVLVTGRDIITLWVARMVMTGLYNMGEGKFLADSAEEARAKIAADTHGVQRAIPFRDVCIHPTILDGKGERMSKTKGNGVDPVEIIETHGADALRLTMTMMATETQDARLPVKRDAEGRNTSDKFDFGRNFCNKLWNAARFVLSNLETAALEPVDETKWSLADRWIVSRFNRAVQESDEAMKTYRFDVYARVCYDFFWRDFCDWYVEATKAAMKDAARAAQTAQVLAATLDGALRLMHPLIPFITETIWWKLNEVRPVRELPGRIAGAGGCARLIKAAWPTIGNFSEASEHIFAKLQEIIGAIRNVRNQYKVDPRKSVTVSVAAGSEPARQLAENREMIEILAVCRLSTIAPTSAPPVDAVRASAAGCDIYIEGLIDAAAEEQRIGKQKADLLKAIAALEGRLTNPGYLAKAPPNLVRETQDQLAAARTELARLG